MIRGVRGFLLGSVLAMTVVGVGIRPIATHAAATTFEEINGSSASQGIIFAGICTSKDAACDCRDDGNCTLDDVLQVFANVASFILGISGTVVLFAFVYGGYCWLFSHGEPKWVERGKDTMTGAVIGLCIIFGSYVALNFIISGLTTKAGTAPGTSNLETTVNQGLGSGEGKSGVFTTE